ncbi:acyltransferase [Nocardioides sp. 503]|uniref:acyltransferase family protein n=1 Tax=Nocardioides sp. 503 TaxID=2508326 RepID=UPI00106F809E|nr:acyltransferase [Nocardioides sp. 503]
MGDGHVTHADYRALHRFPALDGLRAISVVLVFTAHPAYPHVWPRLHGPSGVTLFFVLSGFLITTLLLREHEGGARGVDLRAFYVRRAFRIYPMYLAVFALYCVLILGLGMEPERRDAFVENIPYFLLFFPEHALYFNGDVLVPFDMAWSIGIEEKFYFVWPVLGFVLLKARALPQALALTAIALGCSVAGHLGGGWGVSLESYTPIALGCLVATLLHHRPSYERLALAGRPAVLLLLTTALVALQLSTAQVLPQGRLYPVFSLLAALVLAGLVTTSSTRADWLGSRPMAYVAALSYSLYLLHNFGLNAAEAVLPSDWGFAGSLLSTVVGIALAFVAAHVAHVRFEDPLRRYGVRLARRRQEAEVDEATRTFGGVKSRRTGKASE